MPLFTRRSRSVSISRPTTPASSNPALLAASQAFSTTPAGQKKLAQGAAATALRSMSPTTTPVGQIQTRRMMERQTSVGPSQSAQRGRVRGDNLIRRNSSSSMTERTFREPSPGRPSTATGMSAQRREEPPVPRVPETYTNIPPIPKKTQRRSASIDEIGMRKSSAAAQSQNRNSVAGTGSPRGAAPNPASAAAQRVTGTKPAPPLSRADSNSSVNFSYPGRSRPISPPPQKQFSDSPRQDIRPSTPSKSTTVPRGISQTEALSIQRDLVQVAQQPVKKKKKSDGPLAEGRHLQAGTKGAKPKTTPLEPGPSYAQDDVNDTSDSERFQNRSRLTGQSSHFPNSPTSPSDNSQVSDSDSATDRNQTRRALRASGALQKQPSVVKEDWEGEQDDIPSSPIEESARQPKPASRKRQTPPANVARKIEASTTPSRPEQYNHDPIITPQSLAAPESLRNPSLSPSRSTRFSNRLSSDMSQGQKHDPPPRSVSPRKPALKHSPSPQILPVDIHRARDSSLSPSEGTDVSFDGAPRRMKKAAHVKFDNHPAVVGTAAGPDPELTAESPQVVSPQYREQPNKWYSRTKKPQGRFALSEDSDDDNAMKPRRQLPTFASVRNAHRSDADATPAHQGTSSPLSSSSSSSISSGTPPATMDTSVSSDNAIAGLLSREQQQNNRGGTAIQQPQFRSSKDAQPTTSGSDSLMRDTSTYDRVTSQPVLQQQRADPISGPHIPSIAVQPATPGTEEFKHNDQWLVEVPGGFPSASQGVSQPVQSSSADVTSQHSYNSEVTTSHYDYEDQLERTERMPAIQEEESDKDSIYSDAAEDISDLEGDGFGSIAAIVHSPIASPGEQQSELDSPKLTAPQRNVEAETDEWGNASARWKDLAENAKRTSLQPAAPIVERTNKRTLQRPTQEEEEVESPIENSPSSPPNFSYHAVTTETDPEPRGFKKSMRVTTPEITANNTLQNSRRDEPTNFAAKTMRNPMRNSGVDAPKDEVSKSTRSSVRDAGRGAGEDGPRPMRSSLRDSAPPSRDETSKSMRGSMRESGAGSRETAPKAIRSSMRESNVGGRDEGPRTNRTSAPVPAPGPARARSSSGASAAALQAAKPPPPVRGTLQKRNLQTQPAPAARKVLPVVQDDSDSDSSFRKRRRAKANDSNRFNMRRSMRAQEPAPVTTVDRRAVRSLSPVQRRPFSPANDAPTMRSTMRGAAGNSDAPTLRNQDTSQRSSSLFGRRKDAKSPTRPMSLRVGSSSRVADSDDDRRNLPKVYKSRFQDSDDEESDFRPVRGIPRKTKDDDSTDLEDSSDEEKSRKVPAQQKLSSARPTSPRPSTDRPASPTSPETKKKRGFFGRLKKGKDETAIANTKDEETFVNGGNEHLNGKQSANSAALGFNTDAEKEAMIEDTLKRLEAAKEQSSPAASETPAKRLIPQRHVSDTWPLTPTDSPMEEARPYTADGPVSRPELTRHSSSGTPTPSSPGGSSVGKTGKKKRFPLLRKAFGLKD